MASPLLLERSQQRLIQNQPMLYRLGPAGPHLSGRHRLERLYVHQHEPRLMERADQVLPLGQVNPGLPSDGRVHHGEQGGRHLPIWNPAQERRRHEPHQVPDHTTTHGQQEVASLRPESRKPRVEVPRGLETLARLPGRDQEYVTWSPGRLQRHLDAPRVPVDPLVRDDVGGVR